MSQIAVRNLSKRFSVDDERGGSFFNPYYRLTNRSREIWALKNVTFSVQAGECMGVIGRNGSGKSTLLKILARTLTPTKGTVSIEGSTLPLLSLGSGFQENLTGRENVSLYAALLGYSKREIAGRMGSIIGYFGFPDFIDVRLKHYSEGMKVRLAFATIMATNPEVLLIDEALIVGDYTFQKRCIAKIMDFKRQKKTILMVTHNLSLVTEICDRALLLDQGRLSAIGDAESVVNQYKSRIFAEDRKLLDELVYEKEQLLHKLLQRRKSIDSSGKKLKKAKFDELLDVDNQIVHVKYERLQYVNEIRELLHKRNRDVLEEYSILQKRLQQLDAALSESSKKDRPDVQKEITRIGGLLLEKEKELEQLKMRSTQHLDSLLNSGP